MRFHTWSSNQYKQDKNIDSWSRKSNRVDYVCVLLSFAINYRVGPEEDRDGNLRLHETRKCRAEMMHDNESEESKQATCDGHSQLIDTATAIRAHMYLTLWISIRYDSFRDISRSSLIIVHKLEHWTYQNHIICRHVSRSNSVSGDATTRPKHNRLDRRSVCVPPWIY